MEVRRENQVGPFGHEEGESRRQLQRASTKGPPTKRPGTCDAIVILCSIAGSEDRRKTTSLPDDATAAHAAWKTRRRILLVACAGGSGGIEEEQTVMDCCAR